MAQHGGARPGAGRKKGGVSQIKRDLASLAKEHAELALQVLVQVATASESDAARVSAANALLDRGYGKPAQSIALSGDEENPIVSVTRIELVAPGYDDSEN